MICYRTDCAFEAIKIISERFLDFLVGVGTVINVTQSKSFDVCYGGGKANVAVSLAHFGHEAVFLSKIPNNDIAEGEMKVK